MVILKFTLKNANGHFSRSHQKIKIVARAQNSSDKTAKPKNTLNDAYPHFFRYRDIIHIYTMYIILFLSKIFQT